jgi:hypothetical protein
MNADTASTSCTGPGDTHTTCGSTIENFSLSFGDQAIVSADMLLAMSHSFANANGAFSHDIGSQMQGLCIVQSAAAACTPVPDTGVSAVNVSGVLAVNTPGVFSVDIPGVAVGMIAVQPEAFRTNDNGLNGSGLTVTMLHIELLAPDGWIILDVAQADSWAAVLDDSGTPAPTPDLSPPPAPTATPAPTDGQPAALPSTGGPAGDNGFGWFVELAGLMLMLGGIVSLFHLAKRRSH